MKPTNTTKLQKQKILHLNDLIQIGCDQLKNNKKVSAAESYYRLKNKFYLQNDKQ